MSEAIDRFRAAVAADEPLQLELCAIVEPEPFARRALAAAAAFGIPLGEQDLAPALRPDPLGISRLDPVPARDPWPPRHWLPVEIVADGSDLAVDWAHFGGAPLDDPFYGNSIRRFASRPFNRLLRWRTPRRLFVAGAADADAPAPRGLVFHQSRCGSTLVAQMLAALPGAVALSEPPPLDIAVQIGDAELVRAMVTALARRRTGAERRCFLKLDAWHILAFDLFRDALGPLPWVFLYRNPAEIMVSQRAFPGLQMQPGFQPGAFRLAGEAEEPEEERFARRLARLGEAALEALPQGGLAVDYEQLPEALCSAILPHFRCWCTQADRAAMAPVTLRHAKRPGELFTADAESKRAEVTPAIAAAVQTHLADLYARLRAAGATRLPAHPSQML